MAGRNMYERQPQYGQQSAMEQMSQKFSSLVSSLFEPMSDQDRAPGYMGQQQGFAPRGHAAAGPSSMPSGYRGNSASVPPGGPRESESLGAHAGFSSKQLPQGMAGLSSPHLGVGPPPTRPLSRSSEVGFYGESVEGWEPATRVKAPSGQSPAPVNRMVSENRGPPANARAESAQRQASMQMGSAQRRGQSPAAGAGRGGRPGPPGAQQDRPRTYVADADDLLDQHVAYYFRHHPEVYNRLQIARKRPGVYELNGREIAVEWQYGLLPGEQGFLVALDGPLRQPFADYMSQTEANAEYVTQGLSVNALHAVPLPSRMTFDDGNKAYTRLEAMKVAKEQAIVREKAAEYAQMGMAPPQDLRTKYEKTINQKLNAGGRQRPGAAPPGPGPMMGMPGAAPSAGAPAWAAAAGMPPPMMGMQGMPAAGGYPMAAAQPVGPMQGGAQGMPMQGGAPGNLFGNPDLIAQMRGRSPAPGARPGQGPGPMFRFG